LYDKIIRTNISLFLQISK